MEKLTDRQRMALVFDHKAPDRAPIIDEPWDGTISRWKREGMPGNTDYRDFQYPHENMGYEFPGAAV